MLDQTQKSYLAKLIAMIGSAHDGEVAAAARAAERYRLSLPGAPTWEQIIADDAAERQLADLRNQLFRAQSTITTQNAELLRLRPKPPPPSLSAYLAEFVNLLSDWDIQFLRDIALRCSILSSKQMAVIERIEQRTGRRVPLPSGVRLH